MPAQNAATRQGDIYAYDFADGAGDSTPTPRKVVIVQTNHLNNLSNYKFTIAVPLSAGLGVAPTHVYIQPTKNSRIGGDCFARCEQVLSVLADGLLERIGTVSPEELALIKKAMKVTLDL